MSARFIRSLLPVCRHGGECRREGSRASRDAALPARGPSLRVSRVSRSSVQLIAGAFGLGCSYAASDAPSSWSGFRSWRTGVEERGPERGTSVVSTEVRSGVTSTSTDVRDDVSGVSTDVRDPAPTVPGHRSACLRSLGVVAPARAVRVPDPSLDVLAADDEAERLRLGQ